MAELVGEADVLRKDVRKFVDAGGEALLDGLAEHRLADARGERVDGHDAAGDLVRALALKEGIGHLRAARRTLGTAEEDVGVAGVEGVFEVGLVEIGKFKRAVSSTARSLIRSSPLRMRESLGSPAMTAQTQAFSPGMRSAIFLYARRSS